MTDTFTEKKLKEFDEKFTRDEEMEVVWQNCDGGCGKPVHPWQVKFFLQSAIDEAVKEEREKLVNEYGDFRETIGKKIGRSLRFYLLPSTQHKNTDSVSDY